MFSSRDSYSLIFEPTLFKAYIRDKEISKLTGFINRLDWDPLLHTNGGPLAIEPSTIIQKDRGTPIVKIRLIYKHPCTAIVLIYFKKIDGAWKITDTLGVKGKISLRRTLLG